MTECVHVCVRDRDRQTDRQTEAERETAKQWLSTLEASYSPDMDLLAQYLQSKAMDLTASNSNSKMYPLQQGLPLYLSLSLSFLECTFVVCRVLLLC